MLGLIWTLAYWLVDRLTPGGAFSFNTGTGERSINGFTGFYFSFITLSTVGYGDITPVSRFARWLPQHTEPRRCGPATPWRARSAHPKRASATLRC